MKQYFIYSILFINFLIGITAVQAEENGFDKVCHYFQLLEKEKNIDSMSIHERNDFILKKINKYLKPTSNARAAWLSISNAVANQRYELFQLSAESVLNKKWQCQPMKKWAALTGEF